MPNLLILTEVQESMRARYKAMLLEQFPQLTINVVGHHTLVEPRCHDFQERKICRGRQGRTAQAKIFWTTSAAMEGRNRARDQPRSGDP